METLKQLYKDWCGEEPTNIEKLPGSGSNRVYYRLYGNAGNVIGVEGTSVDENRTFIYLAQHFGMKNLPVPEVYGVSDDEIHYIQEDLGNVSLFDEISQGRSKGGEYNAAEVALLRRTIACLPSLQITGAEGLDFDRCYPLPAMGRASIQFDLNYFKYDFLKFTGIDFHELKLEMDMHALADDLMADTEDTFLYRDFQARNVMLVNGEPRFIDFQGGRRGPLQYDVASFLWQASAKYPQALREELIDVYLQALQKIHPVDEEKFRHKLNLFVLFRLLQVLGAYGFRGLFERKKHFLESIAPALKNVEALLDAHQFEYPYLVKVLRKVCALDEIKLADGTRIILKQAPTMNHGEMSVSKYDGKGPLKVRVFSFSYKKGIPQDESGNGGGYVFDCRSTHNPGRYDQYKPLTGLDKPVIDFLEQDGEILVFLESIYKLADAHVERYMKRGFTDLMFSFGCTGGRHRSVYSAQHLAEHLHAKYGIEVELEHREQGIKQHLV